MTKHEALATVHRLLEHAGPKTEILIKSAALRVLVDYPEAADRSIMKCRAKMINGSPVTFNRYDLGLQTYREEDDNILGIRHRVTEFVGEGFYVRSRVPSDYGLSLRAVRDEFALKRSGVDTATVEYIEGYAQHRFDSRMPSDLRPNWVPLFPPSAGFTNLWPGVISYMNIASADDMIIAEAKIVLTGLKATPETHRRLTALIDLAERLVKRAKP